MKFDLRNNRRLRLKKPAAGMVSGGRVEVIDMSLESVGVEHDFPLQADQTTFLEFAWGETLIHLSCTVARTRPVRESPGRYRSGLTIRSGSGDSLDDYRDRIEEALEQLRKVEADRDPSF